jgi:transposase-like protein
MKINEIYQKLTQKQEKAICALLMERTIQDAAKRVGVTDGTLRRWMTDENFKADYARARADVTGQAIARVQSASTKAVDTLLEIMEDREKPASTRVTAAKCLLEMAIKATELENIEARLTALEDQITANI